MRDLVLDSNGIFVDPISGTRFSPHSDGTKNLSKMKALKEQIAIGILASNFRVEYGLSAEKSADLARFSYKINTSPTGTFNMKDYDMYAKELLGVSITEMDSLAKSGDMHAVAEKIKTIQDNLGVGPEGFNALMLGLF